MSVSIATPLPSPARSYSDRAGQIVFICSYLLPAGLSLRILVYELAYPNFRRRRNRKFLLLVLLAFTFAPACAPEHLGSGHRTTRLPSTLPASIRLRGPPLIPFPFFIKLLRKIKPQNYGRYAVSPNHAIIVLSAFPHVAGSGYRILSALCDPDSHPLDAGPHKSERHASR